MLLINKDKCKQCESEILTAKGCLVFDRRKKLLETFCNPGADPGEVKWVNFHPPTTTFFWAPFFLFFSYSSNIEIYLISLISLIEVENVHKRWLVLPINLFILSPQTHCPACNPKTPRFHALATLRCRRPGQVCLFCHSDGVRFRFPDTVYNS